MSKTTKDFLRNEALALSVIAAFGRGTPVYREGTSDREKNCVRGHIKCLLRRIGETYKSAVCEKDHIENIEYISREISSSHQGKLHVLPPCTEGRLRIGCAQKALNLYLKYLWAFGCILPPPHCPFDSRLLGELRRPSNLKIPEELRLPKSHDIPWTRMDDICVYLGWVKTAKDRADHCRLSLPCWEAKIFEKSRRSNRIHLPPLVES